MALLKKNKSAAVDINKISTLVPLNSIDGERLSELIKHATIKRLPEKAKIFKAGDTDHSIIYLLDGEIELKKGAETRLLDASSDDAKLAIDTSQPRDCTAIARTDVVILIIEQNMLDIYLTWNPYSGYVVDEIVTDQEQDYDDWMIAILQSEVLHRIPPVNIQAMFQKIQKYPVKKDEIIFHQGDTGDYYYLIQSGECEVIQTGPTGSVSVATLSDGQSFGEDALLSDNPRNATIKMLCDGILLRLAKVDFDQIFKENIVITIDINQATRLIDEGANWVDVREPEEFSKNALSKSINIPLRELRNMLGELDKQATYIIYCDSGQRSSCAAYILSSLGYNVYVLENGLQSLNI